jgi:c-di-GMP-binding flagellar brake protein YcgR
VRLLAEIECRSSRETSLGRTENISVGGVLVLVLSGTTFEPKTEVVVRFIVSKARLIEAEGVVVHALQGVRMGIDFVKLKQADREAIAELVQLDSE